MRFPERSSKTLIRTGIGCFVLAVGSAWGAHHYLSNDSMAINAFIAYVGFGLFAISRGRVKAKQETSKTKPGELNSK